MLGARGGYTGGFVLNGYRGSLRGEDVVVESAWWRTGKFYVLLWLNGGPAPPLPTLKF